MDAVPGTELHAVLPARLERVALTAFPLLLALIAWPLLPQQAARGEQQPPFEFRDVGGTSLEDSETTLRKAPMGRLITAGEYPGSTPANYIYHESRFYLPLQEGVSDTALAALKQDARVCFVVDSYNRRSWHSIHVFGEAKILDAADKTAEWLDKITGRFGRDGFGYSAKKARTVIVEVTPHLMTARRTGIAPRHLGKLELTAAGRLVPTMPPPGDNEAIQFDKQVKFVGGTAVDAEAVLRQVHVGRINTLGEKYPYSVPLNCCFFNGKVHFHSKKDGLKIENIRRNQNVSFDVEWFWGGKDWVTVTLEGKARLLPAEEGLGVMQHFEQFLQARDGRIPADFKPAEGRRMGAGRMTEAGIVVVEVVPHTVTLRRLAIPPFWRASMPQELTP